MNHILIRSCPKDDWLTSLCYYSFKKAQMEGNYILLLEDGQYKYTPNERVIVRPFADNFGGQMGVKNLLKCFKDIDVSDEDSIFISDSDIVLFEKIESIGDLSGVGNFNGFYNQVSGQLQILSGRLFNYLKNLSISEIDDIVFNEMVVSGMNVADDSFISYVANKLGYNIVYQYYKWIHYKYYEYNGNESYYQLIDHIKNDISSK